VLDTGCDTSITGARLLPKGVQVLTTAHRFIEANQSVIPPEGETEIVGNEQTVVAVVTKAVHEFILSIDF